MGTLVTFVSSRGTRVSVHPGARSGLSKPQRGISYERNSGKRRPKDLRGMEWDESKQKERVELQA